MHCWFDHAEDVLEVRIFAVDIGLPLSHSSTPPPRDSNTHLFSLSLSLSASMCLYFSLCLSPFACPRVSACISAYLSVTLSSSNGHICNAATLNIMVCESMINPDLRRPSRCHPHTYELGWMDVWMCGSVDE